MESVLKQTQSISDEETAKNVKLAVSIRDGQDYGAREKLRASEFLEMLVGRGVDIAQYLDKNDRLDTGKPTENVRFLELEFDE